MPDSVTPPAGRSKAGTSLRLRPHVAAESATAYDLLGSDRGGHYWFDYCRNQPDATPLPPDPRSLVTPTYDKAVVFNVAWHSCLDRQPATCGELRSLAAGYSFDLGKDLRAPVDILANGRKIGSGELIQIDERIGVRVNRLFEA